MLKYVIGLALSFFASLVFAQGKINENRPDPNKSEQSLAQQSLAIALSRYGDQKKDPTALILAAQIQQRLNTQTSASGKGSVQGLLARAKVFANGRSDLLAIIEETAAEKSRGAERGPTREDLLAPVQGLQNLGVRFVGGVKAMFAVRTEESAKLVVEVLDPNGKPVCVINEALPNKECRWTPPNSGEYQIRIRNVGSSPSEITYFHN